MSNGNVQLPPNWAMYTDSNGRPFYWNHITKETSWTPPTSNLSAPSAPISSPKTAEEPLPFGWEEAVDANSGRRYYINHNQKTTSWERPVARNETGNGSLSASVPVYSAAAAQTPYSMHQSMMPSANYAMGGASGTTSPYGTAAASMYGNAGASAPMNASAFAGIGAPMSMGGVAAPAFDSTVTLCTVKPLWIEKLNASTAGQKCSQCQVDFGIVMNRRHQCRCCFRHFCDNHSKKLAKVEQFDSHRSARGSSTYAGYRSPVRVCDVCFRHLMRNSTRCCSKLVPYLESNVASAMRLDTQQRLHVVDELHQLSMENASRLGVEDLCEIGAVTVLCEQLDSQGTQNEILVAHACQALSVLGDDGRLAEFIGRQPNVINVIGKALSAATADQTKLELVKLLRVLGRCEKYKEEIFAMCFSHLIGLLDATKTSSDALQEAAAGALRAIMDLPSNKEAFTNAGDDNLFILCTLLGAANPNLVEHVMAIVQMLADVPNNRRMIHAAGGTELLVKALNHPVPSVHLDALRALEAMCGDESVCESIVNCNGVAILADIMRAIDDTRHLIVLNILTRLLNSGNATMRATTANTLLYGSLASLLNALRSLNSRVQSMVLRVLPALLEIDEAKELLGDAQSVPQLVSVAQTRNENASEALHILRLLCDHHESNGARFVEARGVEMLIQWLSTPNDTLQREAMSTIAVLCSNETVRVHVTPLVQRVVQTLQASADHKTRVAALQVLEAVSEDERGRSLIFKCMALLSLNAILSSVPSIDALLPTIGCIGRLALNEEFREPIADCGAALKLLAYMHSIAGALKMASGDADQSIRVENLPIDAREVSMGVETAMYVTIGDAHRLLSRCSFAISQLCASFKNRATVYENGGVIIILGTLETSAIQDEVREHLLCTLEHFSVEERYRVAMNDNGGLQSLIDALFSDSRTSQRAAVTSLSNFAFKEASEAEAVHRQGGVLGLVSVLQAGDARMQEMAVRALGALAMHGVCRVAMIQSNVVKALESLLESGNSSSASLAVWLLSLLSYEPSCAEAIERSDTILQRLLPLMTAGESDTQQKAIFALINWSASSPSVWQHFLAMGGSTVLIALLSSTNNQAQHMALDQMLARRDDDSFIEELVRMGGASSIVPLLSSSAANSGAAGGGAAGIQLKAMLVLSAMANVPAARVSLCDAPTLAALSRVLMNGERELRAAAASITAALATSKEGVEALVRANILRCVTELVFVPDEHLQLLAVKTIERIAETRVHADAIHRVGGVVALITLLGSARAEIQSIVTRTLVYLSEDVACLEQILDNDGMRPMARLLRTDDTETRAHALSLVSMLSQNAKFCEVIDQSQALPILVELVTSESTLVSLSALSTLANVAKRRENRVSVVQCGAADTVLALVRSYDVSDPDLLSKERGGGGAEARDDAAEAQSSGATNTNTNTKASATSLVSLESGAAMPNMDVSAPPLDDDEEAATRHATAATVYRQRPPPRNDADARKQVLETATTILARLCAVRSVRRNVLGDDAALANIVVLLGPADDDDVAPQGFDADSRLASAAVSIVSSLCIEESGRDAIVANGGAERVVELLYRTSNRRTLLACLSAMTRLTRCESVVRRLLPGAVGACAEFLAADDTDVRLAALEACEAMVMKGSEDCVAFFDAKSEHGDSIRALASGATNEVVLEMAKKVDELLGE